MLMKGPYQSLVVKSNFLVPQFSHARLCKMRTDGLTRQKAGLTQGSEYFLEENYSLKILQLHLLNKKYNLDSD